MRFAGQSRPKVHKPALAAPAESINTATSEVPNTGASASAIAALKDSFATGSEAKVPMSGNHGPAPAAQNPTPERATVAGPIEFPEVACLWSGAAVVFLPPEHLVGHVRLIKDLLATVTGTWQAPTEQIVFRWADLQMADYAAADAQRALLAFAEKRIDVVAARCLMASEPLLQVFSVLTPAQPVQRIVLPPLPVLARDEQTKRELWKAMDPISALP